MWVFGMVAVIFICIIFSFDFLPIIAVIVSLFVFWAIGCLFEKIDPDDDKVGCSFIVGIIAAVSVFFIIINLSSCSSCTLYDLCVRIS